MRLLFTALTCLISVNLSTPLLGQSVTIQVEKVDNGGLVPGSTYRVYAVLPTYKHSVHAVFGADEHVLNITTTKSFFHHKYGTSTSGGVEKSYLNIEPGLAFDSWVTIGVDNNENNDLWTVGFDDNQFLAGGSLTLTDGSWFVVPSDINAFPNPPNNKVLIMQLTTEGIASGIINLQGRDSEGNAWRAYDLYFTTRDLSSVGPSHQTHSSPSNSYSNNSSNSSINDNNIRIRISNNLVDISKVAVIGKESTLCDGSKDDGQELAELVEGELLGIYGVVERRHLEEILDEQRLAMSGLVLEDTDFAQAGCLAGAQGTVLASYGCLQGETKIQVKLVDCSTSDLYWSATGLDVSAFDLMDALRVELGK